MDKLSTVDVPRHDSNSPQDEAPRGSPTKTVLFLLMPERSAFNASFALAKRLESVGLRVLYMGFEGEFQQHVSSQGMAYITIPQPSEQAGEKEIAQPRTPLQRWLRARQRVKRGDEHERELFRQCEAALRRERVDLVLLDPLIWYFALPPLRLRIPIVGFSTALSCTYDARIPPVFSPLTPTCNPRWLATARNRLAWVKHLWRLWWIMEIQARIGALKYALRPEPPLVSQLRRAGGRLGWSEYGPRLKGEELVAAPAEFDFPECVAISRRVYLGNCVDPRRRDIPFDWNGIDSQKPLVYCSLGTYSRVYRHARRLFETVIAALRDRDDLQAVIQIGTAAPLDAFGDLPRHIHLMEHVPQIDILARAQVFITHGGLSSVREACYFGVPMLVFPCWNDQPGNAARIEYHGLGLRGDIANIDTATLTGMLRHALDGEFADGLRAMKKAFHATRGERAALALITDLLNDAPVGAAP